MNVSFENKFIWWAAPRCASRQTATLIGPFKFWIYYPDGTPRHEGLLYNQFDTPSNPNAVNKQPFTHYAAIPNEVTPNDFDLIINIRNPYDWMVSCWHAEFNDLHSNPDAQNISFKDFILNRPNAWYDNLEDVTDLQCIKYGITPKYLIRFENLVESVLSIPFIQDKKDHVVVKRWIESVQNNGYRNSYRPEVKDKNYKHWYTQELADIVYEHKKHYFEFFDYDKDSWK